MCSFQRTSNYLIIAFKNKKDITPVCYVIKSNIVLMCPYFFRAFHQLVKNWQFWWGVSDCNWTRTHSHLVCKRTLNHLAKLRLLGVVCWKWQFIWKLNMEKLIIRICKTYIKFLNLMDCVQAFWVFCLSHQQIWTYDKCGSYIRSQFFFVFFV